ncbi:MAG: hypothetical protein AB7S80_19015 [Rhizobiaceae bacterium]
MKLGALFGVLLLFAAFLAASSSDPDGDMVVGLPSLDLEGEEQ